MIFGVRAVIEAIQAGKEIDKVLVKKISKATYRKSFCCIKGNIHPCTTCTGRAYQPYYKENHQGVVAFISPITYQRTEDIVPFLFEQGKIRC